MTKARLRLKTAQTLLENWQLEKLWKREKKYRQLVLCRQPSLFAFTTATFSLSLSLSSLPFLSSMSIYGSNE